MRAAVSENIIICHVRFLNTFPRYSVQFEFLVTPANSGSIQLRVYVVLPNSRK